jgi:hypothetical protein
MTKNELKSIFIVDALPCSHYASLSVYQKDEVNE